MAIEDITQWGTHWIANISQITFTIFWKKFVVFLFQFFPKGLIDNKSSLVRLIALSWAGDKPLSGSMVSLFTDVYITTRPLGITTSFLISTTDVIDTYFINSY